MKTPRIVRTISFRLTALYAGLFAVSTMLLFGIVYWIATASLSEQLRLSLESEMAFLEAQGTREPSDEFASEITQRLASGRPQPFHYGLHDASGHRIAGDLADRDPFEGWLELQYSGHQHDAGVESAGADDDLDHDLTLLALGRRLPDGRFLTVAANTYRVGEASEAIVSAFAWAAGATLLLGLAGGITLSQGFLHRVEEINRTTRGIMSGDLGRRIRTGGTDDELDQLGRNLNDMLDRLEDLMDGLKQVSNDIAHDLRTPLSRLKQNLEAARLEAGCVQAYQEAVDQAVREADIALSIFGALLRIAQIESGTRRAHFTDLDLSKLMASLAMTYAAVAEDLGRTLVASVEPTVHIRGDRELLTQLFVNLIENALRHTPDCSIVKVSLRNGTHGPVAEITDDGPGIPEMERANVFKRFYRLEGSRSTPGSGLGLALVAAVADLHGARIALADSAPGLKVTVEFREEKRS